MTIVHKKWYSAFFPFFVLLLILSLNFFDVQPGLFPDLLLKRSLLIKVAFVLRNCEGALSFRLNFGEVIISRAERPIDVEQACASL
jgi:hypothetical protein